MNAAVLELEAMDPDTQCWTWEMNELLKCYTEIYKKEITKQSILTSFLHPGPPTLQSYVSSSSSPALGLLQLQITK